MAPPPAYRRQPADDIEDAELHVMGVHGAADTEHVVRAHEGVENRRPIAAGEIGRVARDVDELRSQPRSSSAAASMAPTLRVVPAGLNVIIATRSM
jgi:hypothetical protein